VNIFAGDGRDLASFGNESSQDGLMLSRCEASEVPDWLARAANTLSITWKDLYVTTNLRGAKRDRLVAWLGLTSRT
jgi:hypothetical protein